MIYLRDYSLVSDEKNVSDGASSRDGQAAQATSSQQLQQGDTVETFRHKYLSSGKFKRTMCMCSF